MGKYSNLAVCGQCGETVRRIVDKHDLFCFKCDKATEYPQEAGACVTPLNAFTMTHEQIVRVALLYKPSTDVTQPTRQLLDRLKSVSHVDHSTISYGNALVVYDDFSESIH